MLWSCGPSLSTSELRHSLTTPASVAAPSTSIRSSEVFLSPLELECFKALEETTETGGGGWEGGGRKRKDEELNYETEKIDERKS